MVQDLKAYHPLIHFFSLYLPHPHRQAFLASCMVAVLGDG